MRDGSRTFACAGAILAVLGKHDFGQIGMLPQCWQHGTRWFDHDDLRQTDRDTNYVSCRCSNAANGSIT